MNKRGSHIGVILSFAIFVTFLIFVYTILEPTIRTQGDKENLIDYLNSKLLEWASSDLTSTIIEITEPVNKDCAKITNIVGADKPIKDGDELLLKNMSEDILTYGYQSSQLLIETGVGFAGLIKIYHSSGIGSSPIYTGVPACTPIDVTINVIRTEENIFAVKILELIAQYESDYEGLKNELGFPSSSDFGFGFMFSNGTVVETAERDMTGNVYVREIPVQYLDEEANIKTGFIIIRIW